MTKPFDIPKQFFVDAFEHVKANAGAAGVDRQSLEEFEQDLKDNTYKLWNRMSSGSYFSTAGYGRSDSKEVRRISHTWYTESNLSKTTFMLRS